MKKDLRHISHLDAVNAIQQHHERNMLWMEKARTLLGMVGTDGIDPVKLAELCKEHANAMP